MRECSIRCEFMQVSGIYQVILIKKVSKYSDASLARILLGDLEQHNNHNKIENASALTSGLLIFPIYSERFKKPLLY